jgi:hypothetical protein
VRFQLVVRNSPQGSKVKSTSYQLAFGTKSPIATSAPSGDAITPEFDALVARDICNWAGSCEGVGYTFLTGDQGR